MIAAAPNWLRPAYGAALIAHGVFFVLAIGRAATAAIVHGGAETAGTSEWFGAFLMAVSASPAIPSALALVAWNICRTRGWTPTPGHMALVVAGAVLIGIFFAVGGAT